ncbi:hypothetical protein HDV00_000079 [Rhizophlyctis rosea]|nr:hypothetical protein HDV00_000079 [Rhizophlyctis rosea]
MSSIKEKVEEAGREVRDEAKALTRGRAVAVMDPNESKAASAAGALSTVSAAVDPAPHYLIGVGCAGGALYARQMLKNPTAAVIAGGVGVAMACAGYLLQSGHVKEGYDLGSVASLGLLAAAGPKAYRFRDTYHTVMAGVGGVSALGNLTKSYQVRTEKPRPIYVHSSSGR